MHAQEQQRKPTRTFNKLKSKQRIANIFRSGSTDNAFLFRFSIFACQKSFYGEKSSGMK